ncbi:hypothetical protein Calhy_1712 [Caldicellulosiruptor hydrothermalis 108]|uniref:Uncharacterized protein n=1 Tax=Caldicellulosiruptor hydrothermalis (strain DSM 18901 / VKM B-2411 / 108) TaxID=632292 RepID=E4QCL0_CALH1|nr:hypothetical protein [Caldicellulosiruptor hydrothermalis]ADQ07427.1 hypothetical protein Calhy_1712 [Caldicellulosiruptor hydrothermalis 108]
MIDYKNTNDNITPQESIKKYIRIFLFDENGEPIKYERKDGFSKTVDDGFKDLDLKRGLG